MIPEQHSEQVDRIAKDVAQEVLTSRDTEGRLEYELLGNRLALERAARLAIERVLSQNETDISERGYISQRGNTEPTWGSALGLLTGDPGLLAVRHGSATRHPVETQDADDPLGVVQATDKAISDTRGPWTPRHPGKATKVALGVAGLQRASNGVVKFIRKDDIG